MGSLPNYRVCCHSLHIFTSYKITVNQQGKLRTLVPLQFMEGNNVYLNFYIVHLLKYCDFGCACWRPHDQIHDKLTTAVSWKVRPLKKYLQNKT